MLQTALEINIKLLPKRIYLKKKSLLMSNVQLPCMSYSKYISTAELFGDQPNCQTDQNWVDFFRVISEFEFLFVQIKSNKVTMVVMCLWRRRKFMYQLMIFQQALLINFDSTRFRFKKKLLPKSIIPKSFDHSENYFILYILILTIYF